METRSWQNNREQWVKILEQSTGEGVDAWNRRIEKAGIKDEEGLRTWLTERGVTGYARTLLVMERFGYPDFLSSTASELIEGQYADRPQLRPVYDAIIAATAELGDVAIQARKTYVSLVSPRRTFARVQPTTKQRVDLGLRIDGQKASGRLEPSKIHETMKLQIGLRSPNEVDEEVVELMRRAYVQNA